MPSAALASGIPGLDAELGLGPGPVGWGGHGPWSFRSRRAAIQGVSCVSSKKGRRVQRVLRGKLWVLAGEVALCPIPGMEKALLLVPKPVAPRCPMSGAELQKEDSRPERRSVPRYTYKASVEGNTGF